MQCPLCERDGFNKLDKHHLYTRLKAGGKSETEGVCKACHNQIHALFSESEIFRIYNSIDTLLAHEDMKNFVKFIKRKPIEFVPTVRKKKR